MNMLSIDDGTSPELLDLFVEEFRRDGLIWSSTSLACSALLLILYICLPSTRRTPGWLIFRADIFDLFTSICFVIMFLETSKGSETVIAFLVCIFNVTAYSFRAAMYMYLLSIYRNPFQPERHRFWLYVYVFVWTAAIALWHIFSPLPFFVKMAVGLVGVPFVVFFIGGGGVVLCVWTLLRLSKSEEARFLDARNTTFGPRPTGPRISSLAQQRVMRHGNAYFFLFGLRLLICTALTLWMWFGSALRTFPATRYLVVVLTAGGPVFTFIGWALINGCCSSRKGALTKPREAGVSEVGGPSHSASNPILSAAARQDMHQRAVATQGIEESGFKEELRFQLVYNVTKSLGDLAQEELTGDARRASFNIRAGMGMGGTGGSFITSGNLELVSRSPQEDEEEGSCHSTFSQPISDDPLAGFPRRTSAMSYFLRDHRQAIENPAPKLFPTRTSWTARLGRGVDRVPVSFAEGAEACRIRHYGPTTFQSVRDSFGISRSAYAQSFPNDLTSLSSDWRAKFKESVSEGKSGCFFYRVIGSDQLSKLIVKQITWAEKEVLVRILPDYERHIRSRKGKSFICYFGCHSMRLSWTLSRKVYFVVMRNFLPASMWLTFDLKGATANRRTLAGSLLYKKGEETTVRRSYGTLRDWEWLDIAMSVDVSFEDRTQIRDIIDADAQFLGSNGLLDYSLLLGIHRVPKTLVGQERKAYLQKMKRSGGYVSLDQQKVYFFGIIDVLETYNCRWRVQNCMLRFAYTLSCLAGQSDGISAIPPLEYADRFRTFVETEVLHCHRLLRNSSGSSTELALGQSNLKRSDHLEESQSLRWAKLWRTRQQGLVRERIEVENEDHMASQQEQVRRIADLERVLARRVLDGGLRTPGALDDAADVAVGSVEMGKSRSLSQPPSRRSHRRPMLAASSRSGMPGLGSGKAVAAGVPRGRGLFRIPQPPGSFPVRSG